MMIDSMVRSVHYQEVDPGLKWVKDTDVAIDSNGPLDAIRTLTPNVLKMEDGYRMYYYGLGPESRAGGPVGNGDLDRGRT